ncbi:LOW QUALITY PROTEIN: eukaryotic translation initiation factor 2-alpha kinase 1-like [Anopheles cruzii]|uniref:LOW QUALITY PROTEIN: eukaryotic translation initiation factor 2-alpha kinase 1-like n=1 Tax=Anopheles cruzii TaxID=68878 RepID=UPI0022EC3BA7|nr:LOW QUALITY PROTEIN: eukaryotic translation initiation factor 2-alpha kinase 1-like [Anopheles cruzii]
MAMDSVKERTSMLMLKIGWRQMHTVREKHYDDRGYYNLMTSAIDLLQRPGVNKDIDLVKACFAVRMAMDGTRDRYQSIYERLFAIELNGIAPRAILEIVRWQYRYELFRSVAEAGGRDLLVVLKDHQALQQRPGLEWSRYHRDFEEVSFVAGGGFGNVFRARNILDGTVYAVKKVPFSCKIKNVSVQLAEVKMLASLNHINIVSLKTSWLEPLLSHGKSSNTTNGSSAMEIGEEEDDDVGPAVSAGEENRNQGVKREDPPGVIVDANPHLTLEWATLYIQMPLCHLTLREWLDERNAFKDFDQFYIKFQQKGPVQHVDVVLDVFQQLLNALNYIHARGIVHHDIKPSNILVSRSDHDSALTIQLADFGLARSRGSSLAGVGFGTPFYAAPEQLEGKGTSDPKSDLFALGIVLLELLVRIPIGMERADMINQVYRGQYPPDVNPDFTALAKGMLQEQPSCRPEMAYIVEKVKRLQSYRDNLIAGQQQSLSLGESEKRKKQKGIDMSFKIKNKDVELRRKEMELQAKDEDATPKL